MGVRYLERFIMASNGERREFEKYLKFLVHKVSGVTLNPLVFTKKFLFSIHTAATSCRAVKRRSKVNNQVHPNRKRMGKALYTA